MYCRNCGEQLNDNQAICLKCGVAVGTGKAFAKIAESPLTKVQLYAWAVDARLRMNKRTVLPAIWTDKTKWPWRWSASSWVESVSIILWWVRKRGVFLKLYWPSAAVLAAFLLWLTSSRSWWTNTRLKLVNKQIHKKPLLRLFCFITISFLLFPKTSCNRCGDLV